MYSKGILLMVTTLAFHSVSHALLGHTFPPVVPQTNKTAGYNTAYGSRERAPYATYHEAAYCRVNKCIRNHCKEIKK